jgi:hypothetical protein
MCATNRAIISRSRPIIAGVSGTVTSATDCIELAKNAVSETAEYFGSKAAEHSAGQLREARRHSGPRGVIRRTDWQ